MFYVRKSYPYPFNWFFLWLMLRDDVIAHVPLLKFWYFLSDFEHITPVLAGVSTSGDHEENLR